MVVVAQAVGRQLSSILALKESQGQYLDTVVFCCFQCGGGGGSSSGQAAEQHPRRLRLVLLAVLSAWTDSWVISRQDTKAFAMMSLQTICLARVRFLCIMDSTLKLSSLSSVVRAMVL